MNCTACGRNNFDDVSFCEFCGTDLRPMPVPHSGPPVARPVPPRPVPIAREEYTPVERPLFGSYQPAAPSATEVAQMGKSLIGSLSLGEKLVGAGVIAAVIGFFMPFIATPEAGGLAGLIGSLGGSGREETAQAGVSLFKMTKVLGSFYFILLAAVASGVLFSASRKAAYGTRLVINGFQVMIGSLFGPGLVCALFFVPMIQSVAGAGYWLLGLGFSAIAAGGLIAIGQVAKTVR